MVEVPAAAITVEAFDAAFFSIGSNDLTQYVMAAARDSDAVAELNDPSHPAVLRLIAQVAAYGARVGRKVSLCGDAGGEPKFIEALLAAGLRALSVSPAALGSAKEAIARVTLGRSGMTAAPGRDVKAANVATYKTILRNILEERPSGTRQRLATALGKEPQFHFAHVQPGLSRANSRRRISRSFSRSAIFRRRRKRIVPRILRARPSQTAADRLARAPVCAA